MSIHLSVTVCSLYLSICNSICLSVRHLNFGLIGSVYLSFYIYFCLILCHLRLSVFLLYIYFLYCLYCILLFILYCIVYIVLYCLYFNGLWSTKIVLYASYVLFIQYTIGIFIIVCLKKLRVLLSLSLGEVRS